MITNDALDRIANTPIVESFIRKFQMNSMMCDGSFVLYSLPYIVHFRDALIENYLEIYLVDLEKNLMTEGGGVLAESLSRGFQSAEQLQNMRQNLPGNELSLFLSEQKNKLANLYSIVESLNLLLPEVKNRGLDAVIEATRPLSWSMRDKYASCGLVWPSLSGPTPM